MLNLFGYFNTKSISRNWLANTCVHHITHAHTRLTYLARTLLMQCNGTNEKKTDPCTCQRLIEWYSNYSTAFDIADNNAMMYPTTVCVVDDASHYRMRSSAEMVKGMWRHGVLAIRALLYAAVSFICGACVCVCVFSYAMQGMPLVNWTTIIYYTHPSSNWIGYDVEHLLGDRVER